MLTEARFPRWRLGLWAGTKQPRTEVEPGCWPEPVKPLHARGSHAAVNPVPFTTKTPLVTSRGTLICCSSSTSPIRWTTPANLLGRPGWDLQHRSHPSHLPETAALQVLVRTPTPSEGLKAVGFSSLVLKTGVSSLLLLLSPGHENTADSEMHRGRQVYPPSLSTFGGPAEAGVGR